jgi:hypothetical protein
MGGKVHNFFHNLVMHSISFNNVMPAANGRLNLVQAPAHKSTSMVAASRKPQRGRLEMGGFLLHDH